MKYSTISVLLAVILAELISPVFLVHKRCAEDDIHVAARGNHLSHGSWPMRSVPGTWGGSYSSATGMLSQGMYGSGHNQYAALHGYRALRPSYYAATPRFASGFTPNQRTFRNFYPNPYNSIRYSPYQAFYSNYYEPSRQLSSHYGYWDNACPGDYKCVLVDQCADGYIEDGGKMNSFMGVEYGQLICGPSHVCCNDMQTVTAAHQVSGTRHTSNAKTVDVHSDGKVEVVVAEQKAENAEKGEAVVHEA